MLKLLSFSTIFAAAASVASAGAPVIDGCRQLTYGPCVDVPEVGMTGAVAAVAAVAAVGAMVWERRRRRSD